MTTNKRTQRRVWILTAILLMQATLFYGFTGGEYIPKARPLANFSLSAGTWVFDRDQPLDQETLDVLKADDILSRLYRNEEGAAVSLFIAYFSTQRTGKTPHSPKNCLPGTGWIPSESGMMPVSVPNEPAPVTVNRYVVSRGQAQSLVLYWYQSHGRVVASEYKAKMWTVLDSVRYRRSDTALVRVVVPVAGGDVAPSTARALDFVRSLFGPLKVYLPS
jgi:EpsI family protein